MEMGTKLREMKKTKRTAQKGSEQGGLMITRHRVILSSLEPQIEGSIGAFNLVQRSGGEK